jgi:hypothetical protein
MVDGAHAHRMERAPALPMSLPAVPGIEHVGEPIIGKAGNLTDHRQAEQPAEPDIAGGSEPDCGRAVRAHIEAAIGVDRMQPAAHILDPGAEAGERIGFETDVAELDGAGARGADEPVALPTDAGIANRAFGIVPDRKFRVHSRSPLPRFIARQGKAIIATTVRHSCSKQQYVVQSSAAISFSNSLGMGEKSAKDRGFDPYGAKSAPSAVMAAAGSRVGSPILCQLDLSDRRIPWHH